MRASAEATWASYISEGVGAERRVARVLVRGGLASAKSARNSAASADLRHFGPAQVLLSLKRSKWRPSFLRGFWGVSLHGSRHTVIARVPLALRTDVVRKQNDCTTGRRDLISQAVGT